MIGNNQETKFITIIQDQNIKEIFCGAHTSYLLYGNILLLNILLLLNIILLLNILLLLNNLLLLNILLFLLFFD